MIKIHLESFQQYREAPITFDSFDYNFYGEFMKYLTYDYPLDNCPYVVPLLRTFSFF